MTDDKGVGQGIMKGVGDVIDNALHLTTIGKGRPHYKHKQSCRQLSGSPIEGFKAYALVKDIYDQLSQNCEEKLQAKRRLKTNASVKAPSPPSEENWRWEPRITLTRGESGKGHIGAEVPLERAIAILSAMHRFGLNNDWTNQMPVASGLTKDLEGKRCIDLVHRSGTGVYHFIELKTSGPDDSDSPLNAAIEILIYGLIYVYSRVHREDMNYDPSKLEVLRDSTKRVNLHVVAPEDFYKHKTGTGASEKYDLKWFEDGIDAGLAEFLKDLPPVGGLDLSMSFRFEELKQGFITPVPDHGFVLRFEPQPVKWKQPDA
jgi:hypothetical protein